MEHYLKYGGRLYDRNIWKPSWVEVRELGSYRCDVCTLCKNRKTKLPPQCNDGHFLSLKHMTNVEAWKRRDGGANTADVACPLRCVHTGQKVIAEYASGPYATEIAWMPPPPPWTPCQKNASADLTPCTNTTQGVWTPVAQSWPRQPEAATAHASAVWPPPRQHPVCVYRQEVNHFNIPPCRQTIRRIILCVRQQEVNRFNILLFRRMMITCGSDGPPACCLFLLLFSHPPFHVQRNDCAKQHARVGYMQLHVIFIVLL